MRITRSQKTHRNISTLYCGYWARHISWDSEIGDGNDIYRFWMPRGSASSVVQTFRSHFRHHFKILGLHILRQNSRACGAHVDVRTFGIRGLFSSRKVVSIKYRHVRAGVSIAFLCEKMFKLVSRYPGPQVSGGTRHDFSRPKAKSILKHSNVRMCAAGSEILL